MSCLQCKPIGLILLLLVVSACSTAPIQQEEQTSHDISSDLGNIEMHTSMLADELFLNMAEFKQYRYGVVQFVPSKSLKSTSHEQGPLMLLGHQLEQGMMTEAVRRGFITQDYKVTNDIIIESQSERVFSRDVSQLHEFVNVDFYISGTITEQQGGAIVNARVIHVQTRDVVAAATKFFPAEVFWQTEKVTTRNGMLYRLGE